MLGKRKQPGGVGGIRFEETSYGVTMIRLRPMSSPGCRPPDPRKHHDVKKLFVRPVRGVGA